MKRAALLMLFLCSTPALLMAEGPWSFKGTVMRMRLAGCAPQKSMIAALAGVDPMMAHNCPEYTILSDKVVYVVVGRRPEEFMPLAENIDFLIRKNELVTFSDDEKNKSRFVIQQMILRSDWDRDQQRREDGVRQGERNVYYGAPAPSRASASTPGR